MYSFSVAGLCLTHFNNGAPCGANLIIGTSHDVSNIASVNPRKAILRCLKKNSSREDCLSWVFVHKGAGCGEQRFVDSPLAEEYTIAIAGIVALFFLQFRDDASLWSECRETRHVRMHLGDYLDAALQRAPSALALVDHQVRWTYADLVREVEAIANGLWLVGLRPGDRVMVLLRNRREHVVVFWACQRLGLVYVPVSHRFAANDIAYCIEDAEPEVLFFDEASESTIHSLAGRKRLPKEMYEVGLREQAPSKSYDRLRGRDNVQRPSFALGDEAIAVMLYSSGVTGKPKGIPRSHSNEISSTLAHIIHNAYRPGESTVAISSFCHTMGLRMLLAMTFLNGKLILPEVDVPEAYATLIKRENVSSLYAFPGAYHDLLAIVDTYDVRSLKKIAYAGAPMPDTLLQQCLECFSADMFVNHFGSTEIYTYTICSWLARKPLCAGKAGINTQLRLVAPMGKSMPEEEVGAGEIGELVVKLSSPEAFRGYWNRPDLTAQALRRGWFFTGDLARMDAEGDLWVVGRVDDMVISGGEKIYPSEVETVLRAYPRIKEVAVLGIPDKRAGQLLTAFVVPADPTLTTQELEQFCAANYELADFKRPARFIFLDHLPLHHGKLLRKELVRFAGER